jgi:hypothetical protein
VADLVVIEAIERPPKEFAQMAELQLCPHYVMTEDVSIEILSFLTPSYVNIETDMGAEPRPTTTCTAYCSVSITWNTIVAMSGTAVRRNGERVDSALRQFACDAMSGRRLATCGRAIYWICVSLEFKKAEQGRLCALGKLTGGSTDPH